MNSESIAALVAINTTVHVWKMGYVSCPSCQPMSVCYETARPQNRINNWRKNSDKKF
jgi:hypothetical protein